MKILYDHQIFEMHQFGGISRYFYELWRHAEIAGFSASIALKYCKSHFLLQEELLRDTIAPFAPSNGTFAEFWPMKNFCGKRVLFEVKKRFFSSPKNIRKQVATNRANSLRYLAAHDYDLLHPTYYDPYFLNVLHGKPFVVTVHDMIHEIYPEYYEIDDPTSHRKHLVCEAAARIIAVSEYTKQDLVKIFHIDPAQIDVIYHGNSLHPVQESFSVNTEIVPETYILFVGKRRGYKNFEFFMKAIANILIHENVQLVCTGRDFSSFEYDLFESLGIQRHLIHIAADDRMLAYLYQHAIAFVFPSRYEGFGMPVLEAFACGCPTILSRTSSLPEIGGDAAIYFDPTDQHDIQAAVTRILYHEDIRSDLVTKGYERLQLFSWEKTAQKTCAVYKKAMEH